MPKCSLIHLNSPWREAAGEDGAGDDGDPAPEVLREVARERSTKDGSAVAGDGPERGLVSSQALALLEVGRVQVLRAVRVKVEARHQDETEQAPPPVQLGRASHLAQEHLGLVRARGHVARGARGGLALEEVGRLGQAQADEGCEGREARAEEECDPVVLVGDNLLEVDNGGEEVADGVALESEGDG